MTNLELAKVVKYIEVFAENVTLRVSTRMEGDELYFTFRNSYDNQLTVKYDLNNSYITPKYIYENSKKVVKRHYGINKLKMGVGDFDGDCMFYCAADVRNTKMLYDRMHGDKRRIPTIKDVIFNGPATIVIWADNTKTIVKCQEGDTLDPEKGLAMAIAKKALGNKGNFNDEFKKWLPKDKE